ncbi:hypothetical protein AB0D10_45265 [Kitasatospora sp. NPDC048545]|uniref:hypothetical protein n=1 Tax=Kitasatospora sp. NPDC048545 TaxID=3157208 RepID=UPI0033F18E62
MSGAPGAPGRQQEDEREEVEHRHPPKWLSSYDEAVPGVWFRLPTNAEVQVVFRWGAA